MAIQPYASLESSKKLETWHMLTQVSANLNSKEAVRDNIEGKTFDYGKNFFVACSGDEVQGTIGIITWEMESKGEIYITSFNVSKDRGNVADEMLKYVIRHCRSLSSAKLRLGVCTGKEFLISIAEENGFRQVDQNYAMRLYGHVPDGNIDNLQMIPLSTSNSEKFLAIHNAGAIMAPNGGTMSESEVGELLEKNSKMHNGLCLCGETPVGVYMLISDGEIGWIDWLSVDPAFQGRGIGRAMLTFGVSELKKMGSKIIKLGVFASNTKALGLYIKSGFLIDKIHSTWLEI